ncbi:MAG: flagellar hook protein FlgE [Armatimonadota bacterium]
MNRALFAGLSGTLAFQERMDVVGNNIANANTVGYKESRTAFADALYETIEGGRSGGQAGIGGSNPVQIGSGVSLGAVSVQHAQGSLERTGQRLDCAVEGEGMFVLSDGQGRYFSRDGSFTLDNTNTLVSSSSGHAVVGWKATDGQVDASGDPARLSFDISALAPPIASSEATIIGNLDSTAAAGDSLATTISIYDSLGEAHELELTFTKTATVGEWECEAACEGSTATTTMQFDSSGALTTGGSLPIDVALTNGAASPQAVTVDLSDVTCLAQADTVAAQSQNGCAAASLVSVEMSGNGLVMGHYSDGRSKTLGQIAMAGFTNPGGLRRVGNNLFAEGPASGRASIGTAGTGGRGGIVAGSLEMSNVDLTRAFVDMITTQRGFQASTRVIATANEMMDEVVRLIRT